MLMHFNRLKPNCQPPNHHPVILSFMGKLIYRQSVTLQKRMWQRWLWQKHLAAAAAKSLQLGPIRCDPTDGSPPGSSVPGILYAKILEWVAISFSNACMHAKSLQSCPTLWDPIDGSPPSSPVSGILQARTPFPPPMHESEKWKWSHSVMSDSSRPQGLQPTGLLRPWDFPGKSAGVGCHCLLRGH